MQDLIIVGGGIVGAGIARDAALRGLSVTLLEQHTVGWGTSSRSSRMIHGGIRYLEMGDIHLVHEALYLPTPGRRFVEHVDGLTEPADRLQRLLEGSEQLPEFF